MVRGAHDGGEYRRGLMGRRRRAMQALQNDVAALQQRLELEAWQKQSVVQRLEAAENGAVEQARAHVARLEAMGIRLDDMTALVDASAAATQERLDAAAGQITAVGGRTSALAERVDGLERRAADELRPLRQRVDEVAATLVRQLDEVTHELAAMQKRLDELEIAVADGPSGGVTHDVTDELRANQARMAAEIVRSQQAFRDEVASLVAALGSRRR